MSLHGEQDEGGSLHGEEDGVFKVNKKNRLMVMVMMRTVGWVIVSRVGRVMVMVTMRRLLGTVGL